MLQANELMVGDLVINTDFERNVIDTIDTIEQTRVWLTNGRTYVPIEFISPIPITPKILEKNGFVANKHVYPYPFYEYINEEDKLKVGFAFPQGDKTSYKEPWVYIDSERVFVEHLPCVFVHQLQQVMRLCGITLEIII